MRDKIGRILNAQPAFPTLSARTCGTVRSQVRLVQTCEERAVQRRELPAQENLISCSVFCTICNGCVCCWLRALARFFFAAVAAGFRHFRSAKKRSRRPYDQGL